MTRGSRPRGRPRFRGPLPAPAPGELLPTIVQDARDGNVLILAYSSRESFRELLRTGELVLFSRSRQRIWRKGETSGNRAEVVAVAGDCDSDALLVKVVPRGPMCHTGRRSCFGETLPLEEEQGAPLLLRLERLVGERARSAPSGSYTRELLRNDAKRLKKVGEEASELVVAAALGQKDQVIWEGADLLYHLTVLLVAAGVTWSDLLRELERRASEGERKGAPRPGGPQVRARKRSRR